MFTLNHQHYKKRGLEGLALTGLAALLGLALAVSVAVEVLDAAQALGDRIAAAPATLLQETKE